MNWRKVLFFSLVMATSAVVIFVLLHIGNPNGQSTQYAVSSNQSSPQTTPTPKPDCSGTAANYTTDARIYGDSMKCPSINAKEITAALEAVNSPAVDSGKTLADTGKDLFNTAVEYGVDPNFALGVFWVESKFGTTKNQDGSYTISEVNKSLGNERCNPADEPPSEPKYPCYGGFFQFPTWHAGFDHWLQRIGEQYFTGTRSALGGKPCYTIECIISTASPTADGNDPPTYINTVRTQMTKWAKESGCENGCN